MPFDEFASAMREAGYDEVLERTWQPLQIVAEHVHAFHASARVVSGEMWLTANGAQGAVYWVARRQGSRA